MSAWLSTKLVIIKPLRVGLIIIILLIFSSTSYFLISRLIAQIYFLKASSIIDNQHHETAIALLHHALKFQPEDHQILKTIAHEYYLLTGEKPLNEAFETALKSKNIYLRAYKQAPIDAETVFGLALAERRLEELSSFLKTTQHSFDAMPYYQELIRLSPNMVDPIKAFISYLHSKNERILLMEMVTHLVRVYPAEYAGLKKQPFWSPDIQVAAKKGVQQAIAQKIDPYNAYGAMLSISIEEKDWKSAIEHYKEKSFYWKKQHLKHYDASRDYFQLGRLYLENGQAEAASENFIKAIGYSKSMEKTLESVYKIYKRKKQLEHFKEFYNKAEKMIGLSLKENKK